MLHALGRGTSPYTPPSTAIGRGRISCKIASESPLGPLALEDAALRELVYSRPVRPPTPERPEPLVAERPSAGRVTPAKIAGFSAVLRLPLTRAETLLQSSPPAVQRLEAQQVAQRLQELSDALGLRPKQVAFMVTKQPAYMLLTPIADIQAKLQELAEVLEVRPAAVLRTSVTVPSILVRRTSMVQGRVQAYAALLRCTQLEALHVLARNPEYLTDTLASVQQRLRQLGLVLRRPRRTIAAMLQARPDLVSMSFKVMNTKLNGLMAILDKQKRHVVTLVVNTPALLRSDLDRARNAFEGLQVLLNKREGFVYAMVCHAPWLLLVPPRGLQQRCGALRRCLAGSPDWQTQFTELRPPGVAQLVLNSNSSLSVMMFLTVRRQMDAVTLPQLLERERGYGPAKALGQQRWQDFLLWMQRRQQYAAMRVQQRKAAAAAAAAASSGRGQLLGIAGPGVQRHPPAVVHVRPQPAMPLAWRQQQLQPPQPPQQRQLGLDLHGVSAGGVLLPGAMPSSAHAAAADWRHAPLHPHASHLRPLHSQMPHPPPPPPSLQQQQQQHQQQVRRMQHPHLEQQQWSGSPQPPQPLQQQVGSVQPPIPQQCAGYRQLPHPQQQTGSGGVHPSLQGATAATVQLPPPSHAGTSHRNESSSRDSSISRGSESGSGSTTGQDAYTSAVPDRRQQPGASTSGQQAPGSQLSWRHLRMVYLGDVQRQREQKRAAAAAARRARRAAARALAAGKQDRHPKKVRRRGAGSTTSASGPEGPGLPLLGESAQAVGGLVGTIPRLEVMARTGANNATFTAAAAVAVDSSGAHSVTGSSPLQAGHGAQVGGGRAGVTHRLAVDGSTCAAAAAAAALVASAGVQGAVAVSVANCAFADSGSGSGAAGGNTSSGVTVAGTGTLARGGTTLPDRPSTLGQHSQPQRRHILRSLLFDTGHRPTKPHRSQPGSNPPHSQGEAVAGAPGPAGSVGSADPASKLPAETEAASSDRPASHRLSGENVGVGHAGMPRPGSSFRYPNGSSNGAGGCFGVEQAPEGGQGRQGSIGVPFDGAANGNGVSSSNGGCGRNGSGLVEREQAHASERHGRNGISKEASGQGHGGGDGLQGSSASVVILSDHGAVCGGLMSCNGEADPDLEALQGRRRVNRVGYDTGSVLEPAVGAIVPR